MPQLPSVGQLVAPIIGNVPEEQRPLLVALAEKIAAGRYRNWAEQTSASDRHKLLACADREEEIARRVESLYPDAAAVQADLLAKHPDLEQAYRDLFSGHPIEDQYAIQADGERLGAATWRAFARDADRDEARRVFLDCADLEEASAAVLEALVAAERKLAENVEDLKDWLRDEFSPAEITYRHEKSDEHMRHRFQVGKPHYRELAVPRAAMDDLASAEITAYLSSVKDEWKRRPGKERLELNYDRAGGLGHRYVAV